MSGRNGGTRDTRDQALRRRAIDDKELRVLNRLVDHHVRHSATWIDNRQRAQLMPFDPDKPPVTRPMQYMHDTALETATQAVAAKLETRLSRIETAASRMREGGRIRGYNASRGVGLGD